MNSGFVKPVNDINKDVNGTRLFPTNFSTYPVDSVCFCRSLKTVLLPVHISLIVKGISRQSRDPFPFFRLTYHDHTSRVMAENSSAMSESSGEF